MLGMVLVRFVPALLVLTAIFGGIKLLYWFRATAMRALALRMGFQYTKGDPPLWFVPKDYRPIPTSFRLRGSPVNMISRTWNVIEGEKNGISILILDSILDLGVKKGSYCTFIATRTDQNPFGGKDPQEKIAHSNGWTALYRLRLWQIIPWTMSVQRVEEHLNSLNSRSTAITEGPRA
jgi:hypothetical protein